MTRQIPFMHTLHIKKGEVQEFCNESDAKSFSNLVERVTVNQQEIDNWKQTRRELESKAFDIWHTHLRREYDYLSDAVFDLCYNKAYDDGHSAGYDEVSVEMSDIAYFAIRVLGEQK